MKRKIAIGLCALLILMPMAAWAEKVTITDSTTGKTMIYDTDTGKFIEQESEIPNEGIVPEVLPETKGVPGLNYSEMEIGEASTNRAVIGPGYIIEGRNDVLNGAAKVNVRQTGKNSYRYTLVNQAGNEVHSHGLVKVYMYVKPSIRRPIKITIDGKVTRFADVEGTNYVWFVMEL